jgi:YYY domain-containing protein
MKKRSLLLAGLGGLLLLAMAGAVLLAFRSGSQRASAVSLASDQAAEARKELLLPPDRLAEQRAGGTWSELFDPQAPQNRSEVLGTILWYLGLFLLGLLAYPLVRLAFRSLPDSGYPLARTAGLLLLAYPVWLAGSFRIPFNRATILAVLLGLLLLAMGLAFYQREELRQEWRARWKYYLLVEGLFLAFFLFDLLIRLGNPDLWHPVKGGEKPMDFAFFNAVLKSTSFPPYDPWFAGGFLNYYYYGFMIVGVPVKLLGIVPAFAYNLILPTVFSLIAMGAFSIGWNLFQRRNNLNTDLSPSSPLPFPRQGDETSREGGSGEGTGLLAGLGAALGMAVLGNLGTVRMIFQGYERLAAPGGAIEGASLITRWAWAIQGLSQVLHGASLPYSLDAWYWNPSRIIPAPGDTPPITEFPFFTVLYGDPHAHLFALPVALLALAFALAMVLSFKHRGAILSGAAGLLLGGLAIGTLRPTNTWDFPTYLVLGMLAVGYAAWKQFDLPLPLRIPARVQKLIAAGGAAALLAGLAILLFQPYAEWYRLGYTAVDLWQGTRTPIDAYLTHWGLFLFVIVSWMAWETGVWMARTPLSALRGLGRYREAIQAGLAVFLVVMVALLLVGVRITWLALPMAAWAGVLLLRPDQPDAKRFTLFLVGTGLVLTLVVEVFVLRGDIGRMNTVFKFYLQVWTLLAVSAGASMGWLLVETSSLPRYHLNNQWYRGLRRRLRLGWAAILAALAVSAGMYTIWAGLAKVQDRMVPTAPHTLDGMAYMQTATYNNEGTELDLNQDYRAIRWMQENVPGSPVIVEGIVGIQYEWFSRFSIYTGLPDVTGWEWHERQQRVAVGDPVSPRTVEVGLFYQTSVPAEAEAFLRKYDVQYIILGQLERGLYPGAGLDKFEAQDGILWQKIYDDREMVIYRVMR